MTKTLRIALLVASVPTAAFFECPCRSIRTNRGERSGKRHSRANLERRNYGPGSQAAAAGRPGSEKADCGRERAPHHRRIRHILACYDEYISEVTKILDSRYVQIKDYAGHYATLDDKQAADYIGNLFDADRALMDLRVKYPAGV